MHLVILSRRSRFVDSPVARPAAQCANGVSHRFTRVPIQRTGRYSRVYHDGNNVRRKKGPSFYLSIYLSLSLSCGELFQREHGRDTSTWLGNARPTGGERKRRGSRVRLSVRLSVFLSPTRCSLAPTSWFPLSLTASRSLSPLSLRLSVLSGPFYLSFSFSRSLPLSFYHFVSASLVVPLSPSLALSLSFFLLSLSYFPPLLVFSFLSISRSLRTHTLRTALSLSLSLFLSIDGLFSLVNRRYVDAPIESRERAHRGT